MKKIKNYVCDPARNAECAKALCFERGGPCGATDDVRCALRDLFGMPVQILKEGEDDGQDKRQ